MDTITEFDKILSSSISDLKSSVKSGEYKTMMDDILLSKPHVNEVKPMTALASGDVDAWVFCLVREVDN